jgi:hypothetical protein
MRNEMQCFLAFIDNLARNEPQQGPALEAALDCSLLFTQLAPGVLVACSGVCHNYGITVCSVDAQYQESLLIYFARVRRYGV